MAASVPDIGREGAGETVSGNGPARLARALRRELVRQASRPGADLIVTETAGRWNVSGPVDIDSLAHAVAGRPTG